MSRCGRAALIFALAAGVAIVAGVRAAASCAGPPPGESPRPSSGPVFTGELLSEVGEGTAGTLFEFRVESVERGEVPERVVVDISVDKEVRQPDGQAVLQFSSISIGPAPALGQSYRVETYRGNPGGQPRLFVNACGGSLRRLTTQSGSASGPGSKAAIGMVAILSLGLAVFLSRRLTATADLVR